MDEPPTTRTNADGFKGQYPKPLDWNLITRELGAKISDNTDSGDETGRSTLAT